MGCKNSKSEHQDGAKLQEEVSVDVHDDGASKWAGEELYKDPALAGSRTDPLNEFQLAPVETVGVTTTSDGSAFIRRASGGSFKIKTSATNEKKIKSNASSLPRHEDTDATFAILKSSSGVAKVTGAEFQQVAQRRSSAAFIGVGGSGESGVLNASTKPRFAEVDTANLEAAKQVEKSQLASDFGKVSENIYDESSVRTAVPKPKAVETESNHLSAVKSVDQSSKSSIYASRTAAVEAEKKAAQSIKQKAPTSPQQATAALEKAKNLATKSKFGASEELPSQFRNAESVPKVIDVAPPPSVSKAAKSAIKSAHEQAAAAQRNEKKSTVKVLGAAANDKKHFKSKAKIVKLDATEIAKAQAERQSDEAEYQAHISARLEAAREEREKKLAIEREKAASEEAEAARRAQIKADLVKAAAEAKARSEREAAEAKAAADKAAHDARIEAVIQHRKNMDALAGGS